MNDIQEWLNDFCAKWLPDENLQKLFRNCFLNTYDTTLECTQDDAYVFTGDIPAMWLRDSSAQVTPYLYPAQESEELRKMFRGLLRRQFTYILLDPYANAFNKTANGNGHKDVIPQSEWVWERKYEVDSLCYPLWLACRYFAQTQDAQPFDALFIQALTEILNTFEREQHHSERSDYAFIRTGAYARDTLPNGGKGEPLPYTGMTWSAFRPSDDRCVYNYFIPANMFASVTLRRVAALPAYLLPAELCTRCLQLAQTIDDGIAAYGTVQHPKYGKMYAYETDGKGQYLLMDDANVPSLLSLPYLGYCDASDPVYRNTRRFILSSDNPYYFAGKVAAGVGSPHTPAGYAWHIGLIMQGLTSVDEEEKRALLSTLLSTHADTFYMHEGFDTNDPARFTRPWFAWANSLFAVFVIENRRMVAELYQGKRRAG